MARRLYINGVSLVSLPIMLGGGSVLLVAIIRRMGIGHGINTDSDIAISATLLFIGLPVWAIHHRLGQRTVRLDPDEAGSLFRAIYIYGALLITGISAASVAMIAITEAHDRVPFGSVVVLGSFWMYFLFLEHRETRPTRRTVIAHRLYFFTMSAALISLAMSAFFLFSLELIYALRGSVFFPESHVRQGWDWDDVLGQLGAIFPPGIAWAAHWMLFARRNTDSIMRHIYLYVFAISAGLLIASWNAAKLIQLTLGYWVLGPPWSFTLDWMPLRSYPLRGVLDSFASAATSPLAFLIAGLALVALHWLIVRSYNRAGVEVGAVTVRETSRYALAALSLAALPFGMYLLLVAAKQEIYGPGVKMIDGVMYGVPPWFLAGNIAGLMAFALVGGLLWFAVWRRVGFTYRTNGGVRFARIAYFGSVLIVSGSAACLSLVIVVGAAVAYLIFDRQPAPPSYLYGVPIAILAISALLFAYHLRVLRRERHNSDFSIPPSDPLPPSPPMPERGTQTTHTNQH